MPERKQDRRLERGWEVAVLTPGSMDGSSLYEGWGGGGGWQEEGTCPDAGLASHAAGAQSEMDELRHVLRPR